MGATMLKLSRRAGEQIVIIIDGEVIATITTTRATRLHIEAPQYVEIQRAEVLDEGEEE